MIWAARVCYLESTFRLDDCRAILHVARKRAARSGQQWLDALRAYSVLERSQTPRAREVRALPWGDVEDKGTRWNEQWAQLRDLVVSFAAGSVPDPTPGATQWGSRILPADVARADRAVREGRWIPARVARGVKLRNAFYVEVRR